MPEMNGGSDRRIGRPPREESRQRRGEAVQFILDRIEDLNREANDILIRPSDIVAKIGVTPKAARKILGDIAKLSLLVRPGGGGIHLSHASFHQQETQKNYNLKTSIARAVAKKIPEGASIACSPGSTVALCVRHLVDARKPVSILTNSLGIPDNLTDGEFEVFCSGGNYYPPIHACVGQEAIECFKNVRYRYALIGVSGIGRDGGLFVRYQHEKPVLRETAANPVEGIIIVADATKLVRQDSWQFITMKELAESQVERTIELITNDPEVLGNPAQVSIARSRIAGLKQLKGVTVTEV